MLVGRYIKFFYSYNSYKKEVLYILKYFTCFKMHSKWNVDERAFKLATSIGFNNE